MRTWGEKLLAQKSPAGSAVNPPSITVPAPGQTATANLFVTGQSDYAGTINFTSASCSGLPAESTCNFAQPSIVGNGFTLLAIQTTAPHVLLRGTTPQARLIPGIGLGGGLAVAGLFIFGWPSRRRMRTVLLLLLASLIVATFGCGGSSGGGGPQMDRGTPTGSYTVTITGTSGTTTHSTTFALQVQ